MKSLHLIINRDPPSQGIYDTLSLMPACGSALTLLLVKELVDDSNPAKYETVVGLEVEDIRTIADWLTARVAELDELGALPPRKEPNHEAA